MEFLSELLPIILYILLAALLVILIILFIKLIQTTTRMNKIADDIEFKLKTLNGVFGLIDATTSGLSRFSDAILDKITGIGGKIFKRDKNKEREDE